MLEIRPNCEWCDRDLPPDSEDARICSYECTYCAGCVDDVLHDVCPACGGGFAPRPIRPQHAYRDTLALGLANHPARVDRVHSQWSGVEVDCLTDKLRNVDPARR